MPIYIDVWVNDRAINTYAIGRLRGGTDPDDVNVYAVMDLERIDRPLGWDKTIQFEHRYGDGIDVCIRKGLAALAGYRSAAMVKRLAALNLHEDAPCTHPIVGAELPPGRSRSDFEWHEFTFCPDCGAQLDGTDSGMVPLQPKDQND